MAGSLGTRSHTSWNHVLSAGNPLVLSPTSTCTEVTRRFVAKTADKNRLSLMKPKRGAGKNPPDLSANRPNPKILLPAKTYGQEPSWSPELCYTYIHTYIHISKATLPRRKLLGCLHKFCSAFIIFFFSFYFPFMNRFGSKWVGK